MYGFELTKQLYAVDMVSSCAALLVFFWIQITTVNISMSKMSDLDHFTKVKLQQNSNQSENCVACSRSRHHTTPYKGYTWLHSLELMFSPWRQLTSWRSLVLPTRFCDLHRLSRSFSICLINYFTPDLTATSTLFFCQLQGDDVRPAHVWSYLFSVLLFSTVIFGWGLNSASILNASFKPG